MDQAGLRKLEAQCIQEEPPRCMAACPLHVDARKLCAEMAKGKWNEAWAVLAKVMPLAGVLARICDGPCMDECLRKEKGGAIQVPQLERFCANVATRAPKVLPYPAKGTTVCVFGGGLAGLSAASDMVRKGLSVTLVSPEPGRDLLAMDQSVLPQSVVQAELDTLKKLGVKFNEDADFSAEAVKQAVEDFDAVVADGAECNVCDLGFGVPDSVSLGTELPGLFGICDETSSPVFLAAAGRRAAISVERFTQGASLVAKRENEGPHDTRLYTNIEDVESEAPVTTPGDYDEGNGKSEAGRCLQCECMECVKNCEYLKHFGAYPKTYARRIYNNAAIVMGTRQANTLIDSCMLCGLCETICPENFSMESLCLTARRDMVQRGKMPPSAHDFALRDMEFANSEKCSLTRKAPGKDSCSAVFFPGCQFSASNPHSLEKTYEYLLSKIPDMGLMLRCCGAPAEWAGQEELFTESMDVIRAEWESLGRPEIVVACPTCLGMLREGLSGSRVRSLWDVLNECGLPEVAWRNDNACAIHDPCTSRHEPEVRQAARTVMQNAGVDVSEPPLSGELTECCGFGGLLNEANPDLAEKVAERRASAVDEDYVTYCAMCRDMLARTGKRVAHFMDMFFPAGDDPAVRPVPGYSERNENRAMLRENLLRGLWQEESDQREAYESVEVEYTDEAARNMETRRILHSDVQKVLFHAHASRKRFVNRETGHFVASLKPRVVTYWVEFEENKQGGWLVHNAWSHRMEILGANNE